MQVPVIDISAIFPEIIVAVAGLAVLIIDLFSRAERKTWLSVISMVGLIFAMILAMLNWETDETAFAGMVAVDPFAQFFKLIFVLSAAFAILISPRYLRINGINQGEYLPRIRAREASWPPLATAMVGQPRTTASSKHDRVSSVFPE